MTNVKLLRDKITQSGYKMTFLADKCGLSTFGFQLKVDGKNEFKPSEINVLKELLNLTNQEVMSIFFAENVD